MVDTRATGFLFSLAVFAVLVNFGSLQLPPRIAGRTIHYDFKLFLVYTPRTTPAQPDTTQATPNTTLTSTVTTQTPPVQVGHTTVNITGSTAVQSTGSTSLEITTQATTSTMKDDATTVTMTTDENPTVSMTTDEATTVTVVTTTGPTESPGPTEPTDRLEKELRKNITAQLKSAFGNVTGYAGVHIVNIVNGTNDNVERLNVSYTVNFDAQAVSDCLREPTVCDFTGQIQAALNKVTEMTLGGGFTVERNTTQTFNDDFIKNENSTTGRLTNGCSALLPCMEYGIQVTCRYIKRTETCENVCSSYYCSGGTCRANNNVLNGVRVCECPTHTFHNSYRCLSWWILLGPIIGAGALLIIFLIVMCVLCVRLAQKNKKDKLRNMYNGKDSLQRYHDEGNDNEGFMPQPLPLERYDTTNMANGNTKAAPLEKKPSYREEVSPSRGSDTQQPMQEIGPQSQYRPAAEERQLHRYSDRDQQKGPDTNMYSNNWERELAKQYDSRDFNLSSVPQEKFQFERPKLNSPSHGYAEEPVARF